jgi:hypothetical protein
MDALQGVPLGSYDLQIIHWLSELDDPTARTITSLILRVRELDPYDPCGEIIRQLPGTADVQTCMMRRGHSGHGDQRITSLILRAREAGPCA